MIKQNGPNVMDIRKCQDTYLDGVSKVKLCLTKHHAMKAYWGVYV